MSKFPQARYVRTVIERSSADVYAYVSNPENLPHWAAGLGSGIKRDGENWKVATPQGEVHMRFAPQNAYGVLDHTVTLPDGSEVYVPMRVMPNGDGSEVVMTLFRQPEMDDAALEKDNGQMSADLAKLKKLLEG